MENKAITGAELIFQERKEQLEKHSFRVEDDKVFNSRGELIEAAMFAITDNPNFYPKKWEDWFSGKLCNKSYVERLVIAGALIAAEIDRLKNATSVGMHAGNTWDEY